MRIGAVLPSLSSTLPPRYSEAWKELFLERVSSALTPGMTILDVGSGCAPTLAPEARPADCIYVGLDISDAELLSAPPGSYDETHVSDIVRHQPELDGRFDLVLSWQVLEHVRPLDSALGNIHSYLKPGGQFVAQFSGTFSAFGMLNQVIPHSLSKRAMETFLKRDPESVFPAYYHHCWHGKLVELLEAWQSKDVIPRYRGGTYWRFLPPLQSLYMKLENWAADGGHANLATHYIIDARR